MSLDFSLYIGEKEVFEGNITHNLSKMAHAIGVWECIWYPTSITFPDQPTAKDIINKVAEGLSELIINERSYMQYNISKRNGDTSMLIEFLEGVLKACIEYPDAVVVSQG